MSSSLVTAPNDPVSAPRDTLATHTAHMNNPYAQPSTGADLTGRKIFGQYTIVKKLGEGGMGAVYQARQDSIDQLIAIKVLLSEAAKSQEIVQRFHREAKVISMLTHPNIIRVFIFGRMDDGLLYLAMEYVQGRELRQEMRGRPMDELLAIRIMKQSCSALAEAHDLGIIHRDLKPDNILLTHFRGDPNFVKILDFGIAKLKDTDTPNAPKLTQAGIVYGTPEYLSPEQAQALELDQRTDIYSLGIILFEMLTGRVPFMADSPVKILTKHVFEQAPRPNDIAGGTIAPTMENIILKAMAKDPNDRFASAMDMFRALVMREQEILQAKGLGADANWVPGSELTGMFQAVRAPEQPTARAPQQHAYTQPTTQPTQQPTMPTYGQQQPQNTFPVHAQTGAMAQPGNNSNKLIIAVIAVGLLIFICLIVVIIVLAASQ